MRQYDRPSELSRKIWRKHGLQPHRTRQFKLSNDLLAKRRNAGRAGLVTQQSRNPLGHEALLPAPDGRLGSVGQAHDLRRAATVRRQQDDPRPPNMLLWTVSTRIRAQPRESKSDSTARFYPLSCSPFQAAGTYIPCLSSKLFSAAATGQGRRHDHETTVDHALMRGLGTAGTVMRRGASSV
jgi:hypothetical protein